MAVGKGIELQTNLQGWGQFFWIKLQDFIQETNSGFAQPAKNNRIGPESYFTGKERIAIALYNIKLLPRARALRVICDCPLLLAEARGIAALDTRRSQASFLMQLCQPPPSWCQLCSSSWSHLMYSGRGCDVDG